MTARRNIPSFIRPCLWSYDTRTLDLVTSAETILTQVLNYGDWRAVRWALATYEPATIRHVVAHPRRGQWFPQVLSLWMTVYRVTLPPWLAQVAIRDLNPDPERWKALERYRKWCSQRRKPFYRVRIRRRHR